ncbi:MAG: protein arginine kinase [Puniceicoccales bacterium]|jgi:protein arginine kinase|nr:protein arginine kinase [Puniceicoccales bacterium]
MMVEPLISAEADLMRNIADQQPVVLSTRIRLARNLTGHPFPGHADATERRAVLELCERAIGASGYFRKGYCFHLDFLDEENRSLLVERHLISRELAGNKNCAVFITRDQTCSVMVNEEDHLRIQVMRGGYHFGRVWKQALELDSALDGALKIAFNPDLGYLTTCPTNLGTGLRGSAMLHLPGLVLSGQMDKVIKAVSLDGLTVRGWLGEGSEAAGSIFQVSNQHTLGLTETQILNHLEHWLERIIERERDARLRLLESDPVKLHDIVARSVATLRNARLLCSCEAMSALSLARLACDLGMLPAFWRLLIDRLFIENQPAHMRAIAGKKMEGNALDALRATLVREATSTMPPLAFDILD